MIRTPPLPTAGQALQPQEPRITLSLQLSASLRHLKQRITLLPEPYACCVLFFTVAAEGEQSGVFFVRRATLEAAWREGSTRVRQWAWMRQLAAVELRIEWPDEIMVIGNRIPTAYLRGAASAWALADDDLEQAHLLPPPMLTGASQLRQDAGLSGSASPALPALSEVNLLLRLQGLHVDRHGVQTGIPATPAPQRAGPQTHDAALQMRSTPTNESHGADCNRRCVSQALLLARAQMQDPALAQAELVHAVERAFACLERDIAGLQPLIDAVYIEQAMWLVVFTRHAASRNGEKAYARILDHMERLAKQLDAIGDKAVPGTKP